MIQTQSEKSENIVKSTAKNPLVKLTDICLIVGKRGTGKTTFSKYWLHEIYKNKLKLIIYDPLWQYQEFGEVIHDYKKLLQVNVKDIKTSVVFQPKEQQDGVALFDAVAKFVLDRGNILFFVEEIDEYMTPYNIPPYFRALIRRGRNYGIGHVGVTHRPGGMNLNYLTMVDHWFVFRVDGKSDLQKLNEYMDRADSNPPINEDTIAKLADRHFIHLFTDRTTGHSTAKRMKPIVPKPLKRSDANKPSI